jgi:hypothetical protein
MEEVSPLSVTERKKFHLQQTLRDVGIEIPDDRIISSNPDSITKPREWLLRGQPTDAVFTDPDQNYSLQWYEGELTRGGVFFSDNWRRFIVPPRGAIFAYHQDAISDSWLIRDTRNFEEKVEEVAQEHGYRTTTMGGYHKAAMIVQQQYATYERSSGIATSAKPVPLTQASHIFLTPNFLSLPQIDALPEEIRGKISFLPK